MHIGRYVWSIYKYWINFTHRNANTHLVMSLPTDGRDSEFVFVWLPILFSCLFFFCCSVSGQFWVWVIFVCDYYRQNLIVLWFICEPKWKVCGFKDVQYGRTGGLENPFQIDYRIRHRRHSVIIIVSKWCEFQTLTRLQHFATTKQTDQSILWFCFYVECGNFSSFWSACKNTDNDNASDIRIRIHIRREFIIFFCIPILLG